MDIINKDIINLSSNRKMSLLMTSTPICAEDLCERIEADPKWKTTKYKAFLSFPCDYVENENNGLWGTYWRMYDKECMADKDHKDSLEWYSTHRAEMDKGAITFATRYNANDGHISVVQALMDRLHLIGRDAYMSEM